MSRHLGVTFFVDKSNYVDKVNYEDFNSLVDEYAEKQEELAKEFLKKIDSDEKLNKYEVQFRIVNTWHEWDNDISAYCNTLFNKTLQEKADLMEAEKEDERKELEKYWEESKEKRHAEREAKFSDFANNLVKEAWDLYEKGKKYAALEHIIQEYKSFENDNSF